MSRKALLGLVLLAAIGGFASGRQSTVWAQATDARPAFVYGINAAVPGSYVGTFAPADDAIALLADEVSMISPRQTEIYFWPITNEYRANWNVRNDPVPGTLEIRRGGTLVAELAPTDYTIHFTQRDGETSAELFVGQAAREAEASFRARQQAFRDAADAYQDAERAWLAAAADANTRQQAGETVELPPPPERPEPIGVFSNGLNQGIAVELGAGEYQIWLRAADGTIVPGSARGLTVFAARRTAAGYTVVPETRWTTPLESPASEDVIFGAAGTTLYLEPRLAREYPAREWSLLQNPQGAAGGAGWEWVTGEPLAGGVLEVMQGERVSERRELTPYQVKQIPGSQLGYEVIPFSPDEASGDAPEAPEFAAYPITLATAGEQYQVRLVAENGDVLPGSVRQVRAAAPVPLTRLFLFALAPLAVGMLASVRRGRRITAPRELAGTG